MKEKQLQPIDIPVKFDKEVEKEILAFLFEALFKPVLESMKKSQETYFNSVSAIDSAIRSGKIQYSQGIFKGKFSAATAKEFRKLGMKYDKRIKGYRKELVHLPISTQVAISQTASAYQKTASSMISAIDGISYVEKLAAVDFAPVYKKLLDKVDSDFTKTVTDKIGISVDLTDKQKQVIADEFSNNLKLYVKDFTDKEILTMRKDVEDAVFKGIRAESLQKTIKDRFGVSELKAKFLASQEIKLLTSKYKQAKYQEVGINKYRWSTSKDSRVREDHKDLNGKIFSFDDPPVENKDTGNRANPGEPFGCRCVAIPIIEV